MENMLIDARYHSSVIPGTLQANFAPLKEMIAQQMKSLDGIEATDDNLKAVKETLAFLRKFKTGMNACLKEDLAAYNKPVEAYKISFNDMMLSVDEIIEKFAKQVDDIVLSQKNVKKLVVQAFINEALSTLSEEMIAFINSCDWFFIDSWTNKTTSESSIKKDIAKRVSDVCAAVELLDDKGKYAPYMLSQYKGTGDLMGCLDVRRSLLAQDEAYAEKVEPVASSQAVSSDKEEQEAPVLRAETPMATDMFNYEVAMTVPADFLEIVKKYVRDNGFSFTVLSKGVMV
jgi:hypothetical protein